MRALSRALAVLSSAGTIAFSTVTLGQSYSTPVGCEDCIVYWYYVDHGDRTDYDCGTATYPGHTGSDYSLRGGNGAIDEGYEIVAAAAGVVTTAVDGNFDRCTSCGPEGGDGCGTNTPGGGFANYVVLDHGTHTTVYGHMRQGSVAVAVGDSVACGQVLGHIGSAGCSSGAHLHFEPRLKNAGYGQLLDPYVGGCSPTEQSLWVEQGPYRGMPGDTCEDSQPACPAEMGRLWTCSSDGSARSRCIDGTTSTETCEWGCTAAASDADDACALAPDGDGDGVRADTDCDDTLETTHPGAVDVCGDEIDQDCSGSDAICDPGTGGANTGGVGTTDGASSSGGGGEVGAGGAPAGGAPPNSSSGGALPTGGSSSLNATGGSGSGAASGQVQAGCQCAWRGGTDRRLGAFSASLLGILVYVTRGRRRFRSALE